MHVAIIYNRPAPSHYDAASEQQAVQGVLVSVSAVRKALEGLGHAVRLIPLSPPLEKARERLAELDTELVFNLFEGFTGFPGTESAVPRILAEMRIPFTGCPPATLELTLNKARTSALLRENGIETPAFQVLGPVQLSRFRLRFPCIVKPNAEDASHGLTEDSVVYEHASLKQQVAKITERYGEALVEEFIDGREFNATAMGNREARLLAVSEIAFTLPTHLPRILTYAAKWHVESDYYRRTNIICPAIVTEAVAQQIKDTVLRTYSVTGCRGYARVDMRMDDKKRIKVVDVNPNPDISPGSGAVLQAQQAGMDYPHFISEIVSLAMQEALVWQS